MTMQYPHVVAFVSSQMWAMEPGKLAAMLDVIRFRAAGGRFTDEEIRARVGAVEPAALRQWDIEAEAWAPQAAAGDPQRQSGGRGVVAVIPLRGIITNRAGSIGEWSGGTSAERVTSQIRAAVADQSVKGIVLDIDSPGGSVEGMPELAAEVRAARDIKPVEAVANAEADSAAFWVGSQATRFTGTQSARVGSLGVYTSHEDISAQQAADGVKTTLIADDVLSKYKTEGNPFEPMSAAALAYARSVANDYADMFAKDVAKGRGVGVDTVRKTYGQGRSLVAANALSAGMIDGIGTLDDAVRRVAAGRSAVVRTAPAALMGTGGADDVLAAEIRMHME